MTKLVRCIDADTDGMLEAGKIYSVAREYTNTYMLDGFDGLWIKSRFEVVEGEQPSPLNTQVGGSHYKDMPIQPLDYIVKNGLGFCEGNVVKYVSRYKAKGGVEDLKKARHYLDVLIGLEEGAE